MSLKWNPSYCNPHPIIIGEFKYLSGTNNVGVCMLLFRSAIRYSMEYLIKSSEKYINQHQHLKVFMKIT